MVATVRAVAVYAISLNEEHHVQRFLESVRDADMVVVADTGSTDGTVAALQESSAQVHRIAIRPWRFDDARNAALALVPTDVDVCISLDLDEVLELHWRHALESVWTAKTTRMRYPFVASWNGNGLPGTCFWNDRVHARHGYRWRMPVHEALVWHGEGEECVATSDAFEVHHFPDESKSRGQYLPMLERAVRESPSEPRAAHYLGREYFFHKRYQEAIGELKRHLSLPGAIWPAQRSESCRLIGKCYQAVERGAEATAWFWEAVHANPERREPWVDLCYQLYCQGDFTGGYYAASSALSITQRSTDYFSETQAWGPLPHDILSICAWHVGALDEAIRQAQTALSFAPDNQRIKDNLVMFQRQRYGGSVVEQSRTNTTCESSDSTTDDLTRQRNEPT